MQKTAAAVHDLSGFGKCSLTVILPVLSAAGIACSAVPTAVLSSHTGGLSGVYHQDFTEGVRAFARQWSDLSLHFDALYTGYMSSPGQIAACGELVGSLRRRNTLFLADPALGDHGRLYRGISKETADAMLTFCRGADLILPNRTEAALLLGEELRDEIDFRIFLQYIFFTQWTALREYANEHGIQIIGDIPIYVSADSVDVWTHPKLFKLKTDLSPKLVAGVPPDYYSATGQLWGNPVYDWDAHRAEGFAWWIWRMKSNMALFDVIRLDHFRGFAAYWEVRATEETAIKGHWRKGPGMELFHAMEKALGTLPLIAEDLGEMTDEVRELLAESGFPGMKVLIFGFTPDCDNEHLPHNFVPNSIVYTSTHDSQTVCEQIMDICTEPEKQFAYRYLRTSHSEAMGWSAIKSVWASPARITMTTLQDLLSLGADSRMNTPATIGGKNWRWRVRKEALNPTVSAMLGEITKTYMRG